MPRPNLYIKREFGLLKAKRTVYAEFVIIGCISSENANIGASGEIIILIKGCGYTPEEVLHAYNTEGYPPIERAEMFPKEAYWYIHEHGFAQYVALLIQGKEVPKPRWRKR